MDQTTTAVLASVPALAIIIAAVLLRRAGPGERILYRTLLFFEIIILTCLALLTVIPLIPPGSQRPAVLAGTAFLPAVVGLIILVLIYLPRLGTVDRKGKRILVGLGLAILAILVYHLVKPGMLVQILPSVIVVVGGAWLITRKPSGWIWALGFITAGGILLMNSQGNRLYLELPRAIATVIGILIFLVPVLTVSVAAVFLYTGIQLIFPPSSEPGQGNTAVSRISGIFRLITAAFIIGCLVYSVYWESIWDQTSDGLSGLGITMFATLAAIVSGMVMSFVETRWRRLVGFCFLVAVPVLVVSGFNQGWKVNFPTLTEQRAARIAQALERFYNREHRYPQELAELMPRDLLIIPQPVMFREESWCYTGNTSAFTLAAFFHEYWGLPVSLHVYASAGNLGDQPVACQERLADMQSRYDWTHAEMVPVGETTPLTPAPLPAGN